MRALGTTAALTGLFGVAPLAVLGLAMVVEGPIAMLLAGALAGAGRLDWWPVWLVAVGADLIGDSLLYLLGRYGNGSRAARLRRRLGLTEARWNDARGTVSAQLPRVVVGAKLVDIGAVPAFLATGMAGVPYRRFIAWNAPATAVRAAVLTGLGALAGHQLVDTVLAHPWLAVAGGLALGLVLLATQATIGRIVARRGAQPSCAS